MFTNTEIIKSNLTTALFSMHLCFEFFVLLRVNICGLYNLFYLKKKAEEK
jgi:hypothetical protein